MSNLTNLNISLLTLKIFNFIQNKNLNIHCCKLINTCRLICKSFSINCPIIHFQLLYSPNISNIDILKYLPNLVILKLHKCYNISDITVIQHIPNLIELDMSWCTNIRDIIVFQHLKNLRILNLSYCSNITDINVFQYITKLEILHLCWLINIIDIYVFENLSNLIKLKLNLYNCSKITTNSTNLNIIKNLELKCINVQY